MQEHYTSHLNQSPSLSTDLKNTSAAKEKRWVTQYSPSFDLTTLNGTNGFVVNGISAGDYLGYSASTAGDLNGDGKADLLVGAYHASPSGRTVAGIAYVIFGQASGWLAHFNLATLDGSNGFVIEGVTTNDYLGFSVNTAGDLNGDGKADLVVSANQASPGGRDYAGAAYVVFGQVSGWPANFNLATLNGTNGFVIEGLAAGDYLGYSISTAGDLNLDGKADLVIGACRASPGGRASAGTAYVIFGKASGWPANFNLATLDGTNGFMIEGMAVDDYLGWSVNTAGDLSGDGKADLVIGAQYADPGGRSNAGTAYVIFSQVSGWPANFNLTALNGSNGFVIEGLAAGDYLGISVNSADDLNGDGKADLLVGAAASPNGRTNAGTAYVIFGQASGWPAKFDLIALNGSNGFVIEGLATGDYLGYPISTAGDLNGDGKTDLVVGADNADPDGRMNAGTAYVIFGQASGWPAKFNLTTFDGSNGFLIEGLAAYDFLGQSASTAGDLNGDGKADLVVGAANADPGGRSGAGTTYVIFGQSATVMSTPTPSPTLIPTVSTPTPTPTPTSTSTISTPTFILMPTVPTPTLTPTPTPTSTSTPTTMPVFVNRPPQVTHFVMDQTAELSEPFSFQMASDTFSDPDSDPLTYTAAQSGSSTLPRWLQFNKVTRFFSGTPDQIGTTPINVTASDPYGLTASTQFNINVQNALPISSNEANSSINGGLIGGIIGGVVAVGGLVGAAYFAYKRGFFGSASQDENRDNRRPANRADTDIELTKKKISPVG